MVKLVRVPGSGLASGPGRGTRVRQDMGKEFVIKWNDFRGIYRFFFWVKIAVGWSKNLYNLTIAIGFNFGTNLTVIYFLNRWDQSIIVGSSQDFKSSCLDVSPIYPDI